MLNVPSMLTHTNCTTTVWWLAVIIPILSIKMFKQREIKDFDRGTAGIWRTSRVPDHCSVGTPAKTETRQGSWEHLGASFCTPHQLKLGGLVGIAMPRTQVSYTRKQCAWNSRAGESRQGPENKPQVKHGARAVWGGVCEPWWGEGLWASRAELEFAVRVCAWGGRGDSKDFAGRNYCTLKSSGKRNHWLQKASSDF